MIPKEHGGWAMLLVPYFIGLGVAGSFGPPSILFLLCILAVFMASEPLGIIVRSRRLKSPRQASTVNRAIRWLAIYLFAASVFTLLLIMLYQRWWLIGFGCLGAAFLGTQGMIEGRRLDRTLLGELVGALGLSLSAPGVYYATTGTLDMTTALLYLLTALHSAGSIFYINMRLSHRQAKTTPKRLFDRMVLSRATVVYLLFLTIVLLGISLLGHLPLLGIVAFLPLICKAAKAIYETKPEFSFKRLGLLELANSIVFAILLVTAYIVSWE